MRLVSDLRAYASTEPGDLGLTCAEAAIAVESLERVRDYVRTHSRGSTITVEALIKLIKGEKDGG